MNPISSIIDVVGSVINKIWPDKTEAQKAAFQMALEQELTTRKIIEGQLAVNATEAKHLSVFVAGWRPMIGWICGSSFALVGVIFPILNYAMIASGKPAVVVPGLDMNLMMPILMGMLGMGAMRSYDKKQGTSS